MLIIGGLTMIYCPVRSRFFQGNLPPHVGQLWGQQVDTEQELPLHAADRHRGPRCQATDENTQAVRRWGPLPGGQPRRRQVVALEIPIRWQGKTAVPWCLPGRQSEVGA